MRRQGHELVKRQGTAASLDCCHREVRSYVETTVAVAGEMIRDLTAQSVERRFGAGDHLVDMAARSQSICGVTLAASAPLRHQGRSKAGSKAAPAAAARIVPPTWPMSTCVVPAKPQMK